MLIKKLAAIAAALLLPTAVLAASSVPLMHADTDIHNQASLQRGARNFVNYCMGCHSAQYMRWNRMAEDLGIGEDELEQYLMFTGGSAFDTMKSGMRREDGAAWFGNAPPDLSLIARSRGLDYLYTFLMGYYEDPSRPTGVNNLALANTAMPHVLAHLQGVQKADVELKTVDGKTVERIVGVVPGTPGELTAAQYDEFVLDTVNFLDYVGEPIKAKRERMGVWVVSFLLVFWLLTWLLKREYWKDVK